MPLNLTHTAYEYGQHAAFQKVGLDEQKAPISYRAGSAVGRNTDVLGGIGGAVVGGGAGHFAAGGHPAGAIAGIVMGYLAGRGATRFGQGLTSGAANAYGDTRSR